MPKVNLDFNIENASSGFEPLPADQYPAKIIKSELATSQAGNPVIKIQWEITDGEFTGRKLFDTIPLQIDWRVKPYAELIGLSSGSELDTDDFIGAEAILQVKIRPADEKAGRDAQNEIKKITPMS